VYVALASPVFVFAPLALLLLAARPRGLRHWLWLAVALVLASLWSRLMTGPSSGFAAAVAVMSGGLFVALALWSPGRPAGRAVVAATVAFILALAGSSALGQPWPAVEADFAETVGRSFERQAAAFAGSGFSPELVQQLRALGDSSATIAHYLASVIVLQAIAGLVIAWRWHERVASSPLLPPTERFREYRFSDHAVWLLILGLALVLGRAQAKVAGLELFRWGANLLAVVAVLYLARGLAVYASAASRTARHVTFILVIVAIVLWPIAGSGLALLGLADSWIDFRRRLGGAATGGVR
jgi:hypothetical protein